MTDAPLVSILTPSLNQARWVAACIESVRRQAYPRLEHVVVDGGSSDGTLAVLRAHEHETLRVVEEPGTSQAAALNRAFEMTSGEIVGWLNTDDAYFGVDAVRTAVEVLQQRPDADVVYGDALIADADGRILRHVSTSASQLAWARPVSPLVQPATLVRRKAVGPRLISDKVSVAIDYELWLRLWRGGNFVKVAKVLAIDRDYPERRSRTAGAPRDADLAFLARSYGLTHPPIVRAPVDRWRRRFVGLSDLLLLEHRYELAFPAVLDARWRRAVRQLALPQRWCHVL